MAVAPGFGCIFLRSNLYDKQTEYWVKVREYGTREDVKETAEKRTTKSKATLE